MLIVGAAAAVALGLQVWWWGYLVALVVGHFFLFCNVFRIGRTLELAWAAAFLGLAGSTAVNGSPGWLVTTLATLLFTVLVVGLEMQRPSYHGVWWRTINPDLPAWWEAKHGPAPP